MNSPNNSTGNATNQFPGAESLHRFMVQPPINGLYDHNLMGGDYIYPPDMSCMMKWRNQMAHLSRSLLIPQGNYPFHAPPYLCAGSLPAQFRNSPVIIERINRFQQNPQFKQSRPNQQFASYSPFIMPNPPLESQDKNHQLMHQAHLSSRIMSMTAQDQKKRMLQKQKQKQRSSNQWKQKQVIVIDEDDEVEKKEELKPEPPKVVQKPPDSVITKSFKVTRSRESVTVKKHSTAENAYQKKTFKPNNFKNTSDQKIQQDSFKPSSFKTKKIKKKKMEVERDRLRHRETERERALKEKKLSLEERNYQNRPIDVQGKIMISTYHQAKDPQFKFGMEEYQKQKERRTQSLLSRLQFQGSVLRQQYKRMKESAPNWAVVSLVNGLKVKFGSLPLSNKAQMVIEEEGERNSNPRQTRSSSKPSAIQMSN